MSRAGFTQIPGLPISSFLFESSITGLTTERLGDGQSIRINPGVCADSTKTNFIELSSTIDKDWSALWVSGSGGGRDTGSAVDGTIHVFVIKNPTTNDVDALMSLSPTAPTLPAGYTLFRRVASVVRSTVISNYTQKGDDFEFVIPPATTVISGIPVNALITIGGFPTGVELLVRGVIFAGRSGTSDGDKALSVISPNGGFNAASAPDRSDFRGHCGGQYAASSFGADLKGTASYFECFTNTSGQVEVDGAGTSSTNGGIIALSWKDYRGKE